MFKKQIISIFLICVLFLSMSSVSLATNGTGENGYTFFLPYTRPSISDGSGYVTIVLWDDQLKINQTLTWFWHVANVSTSTVGYMDLSISNDKLIMRPSVNSTTIGTWALALYNISDQLSIVTSGNFNTSTSYTYSLAGQSRYTLVAYEFAGNITGSSTSFNSPKIELIWGEDTELNYNMLQKFEILINDLKSQNSAIISGQNQTNSKLDQSNNWLEKIFNHLDQSAEKQKQEAQTQGNNSTSQGMDAIEDKGTGFANSLGTLTNSMSYNGTECAWNMPQIKLPAISGVMDEVVLLESQPIDFTQWVAIIPSNIMLVIQSLLTIGLIVYCFKELYNTIAYVLTLRKDDNS